MEAVIGRESLTAVYLTPSSAPFAATDRSHSGLSISVGAVIGRESLTAVYLTPSSAPFAATDRSHRNLVSVGRCPRAFAGKKE